MAAVADEWFGRRVWPLVSRSWFRHFVDTSWIVDGDGRGPAGFLIGYVSPSQPSEAVLHLVAVAPNHRRRGIGRALVTAFEEDARRRGAVTITAVAWPDDRPAIGFFQALGFAAERGPGSQRLYGIDAYPDYEAAGEDRAVLRRRIAAALPDATG